MSVVACFGAPEPVNAFSPYPCCSPALSTNGGDFYSRADPVSVALMCVLLLSLIDRPPFGLRANDGRS